jgi:hypothetical protein
MQTVGQNGKMRYLFTIITLLIVQAVLGQTENELVGTWQIEKVVNHGTSSLPCEEVTEYTLTFNADNTYEFNAGPGFITAGKWELKGSSISFFDNKLEDPSQGNVADHAYPFELLNEDQLIIDEYICSELGGKTYYRRK